MGNDNISTIYKADVMNIKQIFERLNSLIEMDESSADIEKYEIELETIENEIANLISEGNNSIPYQIYSNRIKMMINEINEKYRDLYLLHLQNIRVSSLLKSMDENNYGDVVKEIIALIERFILIKCEIPDSISNEFYHNIYMGLLREAAFDRNKIFACINAWDSPIIRENIGRLIQDDMKLLPSEEAIGVELKHNNEGLSYDHLNNDMIKKLSLLFLESENQEYQNRKKTAVSYLLDKADEIAQEKEDIKEEKRSKRKNLFRIGKGLVKVYAKFLSFAIVPVILVGSIGLGSHFFKKSALVKKNYDYETKKVINEDDDYFVSVNPEFFHRVIVKKCSPWRLKENGNGYIRDVVEFNYEIEDLNAEPDIEKILKFFSDNNKVYVEEVNTLGENANLSQPEIIITESFVNSAEPFAGSAILCLFAAIILLAIVGGVIEELGYDIWDDTKRFARNNASDWLELNEELFDILKEKGYNIIHKVNKTRYEDIKGQVVEFQEELESEKNKYGDLMSPELLESARKLTKNRG